MQGFRYLPWMEPQRWPHHPHWAHLQNISSTTNFVKEPMRCGDVKDLCEWVDGKDNKKRR
jgi:hypothetical protein